MTTFSWNIDDPTLLKQIKSSANGEKFVSATFEAQGFKWRCTLYPNGWNDSNEGQVQFSLSLAYLPPKVKEIKILRAFKLKECNISKTSDSSYTDLSGFAWPNNTLKLSNIQDLNQLTFTVRISLMIVLDEFGNEITSKYVNEKKIALPLIPSSYKWDVPDLIINEMKSAKNESTWASDTSRVIRSLNISPGQCHDSICYSFLNVNVS